VRVLLLSHYGLPHLGGMEVVIDAAARELARRGHEVTHLACDALTDDAPGRPPSFYRVLRLPALNLLEERLGVPYPVFGPRLLGALRAEVARADVVHAHGLLYMPCGVGLALARRMGRGRVLTEHVGHVPYASAVLDRAEATALASLGRATARQAQVLTTVNEKVAAELRALAPSRPVEVIANGVDTTAYRPAADPAERAALRADLGWDDTPRVLFVGRLVAKKGVDAALAAADAGGAPSSSSSPGRAPRPQRSRATPPSWGRWPPPGSPSSCAPPTPSCSPRGARASRSPHRRRWRPGCPWCSPKIPPTRRTSRAPGPACGSCGRSPRRWPRPSGSCSTPRMPVHRRRSTPAAASPGRRRSTPTRCCTTASLVCTGP